MSPTLASRVDFMPVMMYPTCPAYNAPVDTHSGCITPICGTPTRGNITRRVAHSGAMQASCLARHGTAAGAHAGVWVGVCVTHVEDLVALARGLGRDALPLDELTLHHLHQADDAAELVVETVEQQQLRHRHITYLTPAPSSAQ